MIKTTTSVRLLHTFAVCFYPKSTSEVYDCLGSGTACANLNANARAFMIFLGDDKFPTMLLSLGLFCAFVLDSPSHCGLRL